uniref:Sushi domain-containing protein n=1 Tax=Mesocestoides corti TaxID=53468 RepID=A0A5K3FWS2_MESCO
MACRPGFVDAKRKYITVVCVGNQWKFDKLDCQRISCQEIKGPENGLTLYTSDLRYQGTAVQFCNDGYRILCPDETGTTDSG